MYEIVPGLWLSNFLDASNNTPPRAFVVNCTKDLPMISDYGVRIPIDDDRSEKAQYGLLQSLPSVIQSIDGVLNTGGKVVVHCMAGQQRSAATVAAYLVDRRGMDLESSIRHIKSIKPDAFIYSVNFMPALKIFANRRCA
jgi:protein-tyrosine phosphatase